ncbi:MAG: YihY/virulence factor BrkB family protein [Actinomycetota bacterium]|nr:YihY/virulence factor BrkB family protein [Actinomycetota bacterium]
MDENQRVLERLRPWAEDRPWLAVVLDVQQRFDEVHGGSLASAVTLAAFLSLFPLALVAIAVVGFFASTTPDLSGQVAEVFGLGGTAAARKSIATAIATAEQSRAGASLVGFTGLLWSALGLVSALEYAYDAVWQVPGRGLKDKVVTLGWLVGAALLFVASFSVTAVLGFLPAVVAPLNLLVGLGVSFGLFLWTAKVLCNREVGWRPLVPGAVLGAVGLEVLKVVGGIYVPRAVASSSALYGSLGIVFAILAWLVFFGRLVVYTATLNVVLWERRHGTVAVELLGPSLPGRPPSGPTRAGEMTTSAG